MYQQRTLTLRVISLASSSSILSLTLSPSASLPLKAMSRLPASHCRIPVEEKQSQMVVVVVVVVVVGKRSY
ncbi:hypothetical protein E2C01_100817 [Portunus trituberculatus]|uniref:Uncharacterized protein n=1 Tax=Portunus trituberculatus TaxID=210409 RepID=A0A5B7K439_PORTR|nr:hypothetical protein [Portunus trituberculatus]